MFLNQKCCQQDRLLYNQNSKTGTSLYSIFYLKALSQSPVRGRPLNSQYFPVQKPSLLKATLLQDRKLVLQVLPSSRQILPQAIKNFLQFPVTLKQILFQDRTPKPQYIQDRTSEPQIFSRQKYLPDRTFFIPQYLRNRTLTRPLHHQDVTLPRLRKR